jgi:hypothetical protein
MQDSGSGTRDRPEAVETEPASGAGDRKVRVPAARRGPGSQLYRFVFQPRQKPAEAPPPRSSPESIKPRD